MRKYLGIVSIPVVSLIAYWIFQTFISGTEIGAMPLFLVAYAITLACWWLSCKGVWKTTAGFILLMFPVAFIILSFSLIFTNYGT